MTMTIYANYFAIFRISLQIVHCSSVLDDFASLKRGVVLYGAVLLWLIFVLVRSREVQRNGGRRGGDGDLLFCFLFFTTYFVRFTQIRN